MNWLEENTLPILFIAGILYFLGYISVDKWDAQAEAEHIINMGYQSELQANQAKE